ncbi:MAG TPA: KUP/HAK/KT family potassium transporter, partial [Acetobacteraceae bacterium]|nr:KUP/HAK/KT family potassium transporter [Acetobacteraceae bacterium]
MGVTTAAADHSRGLPQFGAMLAVLGVVYGDIGTSPLYAFKAALGLFPDHAAGNREVFGILSLIFWSLILIVTVKYVVLIMRADNRGEGGVLALMALAQRVCVTPAMRGFVLLVGIAGACLFFGDGFITPAISVMSAIEGLEVSSPNLKVFVLPISAVVILLLFTVQYRGTGSIGRLFGPVMAVWFLALALLGVNQIRQDPQVLMALSPIHAVHLAAAYKAATFAVLGAVVLCVTGAEALYLDMGHFGRQPIRLTWTWFVLPALALNYFGQGALILREPTALENPFFLAGPDWVRLPLVALSALATVIASQAVISGAYSMTRQCMQLGLLPRLRVRHTSTMEEGQIYVPRVNLTLAVGVLVLVFGFRTSANLASAYGIAVTGTFICDTTLAAIVFRRQFHWPRIVVVLIFGALLVIDLTFFSANTLKIIDGGWVPLVFGLGLMAMMTSWKRGRDLLLERWRKDSLPIAS